MVYLHQVDVNSLVQRIHIHITLQIWLEKTKKFLRHFVKPDDNIARFLLITMDITFETPYDILSRGWVSL